MSNGFYTRIATPEIQASPNGISAQPSNPMGAIALDPSEITPKTTQEITQNIRNGVEKICIEGDSVLISMIELEILLNTQQYTKGEDEKFQGEQNIFTEKNILGGAGYSFELESFTWSAALQSF